jgi:hypothetical protein
MKDERSLLTRWCITRICRLASLRCFVRNESLLSCKIALETERNRDYKLARRVQATSAHTFFGCRQLKWWQGYTTMTRLEKKM